MNKSILIVPKDLQDEITSLAGLGGHNKYNITGLAALRYGLKALIGEARVRRAVLGRPQATEPEPPKHLPPTTTCKPISAARKLPRNLFPVITESAAPLKQKRLREGDTVSSIKKGCICSVCGQPFEVDSEEFEELMRIKRESGKRPVCEDCTKQKPA